MSFRHYIGEFFLFRWLFGKLGMHKRGYDVLTNSRSNISDVDDRTHIVNKSGDTDYIHGTFATAGEAIMVITMNLMILMIWMYSCGIIASENMVICHIAVLITAIIMIGIMGSTTNANPGIFPSQLTPESIKEPHKSYPYNLTIAEALYKSTYLESWGSGAKRIMDACRDLGVEEPLWKCDGGFVTVTFKRPNQKAPEAISEDTPLNHRSTIVQVPSKFKR